MVLIIRIDGLNQCDRDIERKLENTRKKNRGRPESESHSEVQSTCFLLKIQEF